ncbi:MAG: tRNA (adenosine(37)-N6)-dimethylallyltransferase MiaA [Opitutaceae bacterium]
MVGARGVIGWLRMAGVVHILTGPTAVGKTAWALRWAQERGAEIVSCDSLLFYRGMDIGTAKPTVAERALVPHHLIDVCPVQERVSVVDYVAWAREAVTAIASRGRAVLVVGGSGFYLKCFFGPVRDEVNVPVSLRDEVDRRLRNEGLEGLVRELRRLNPAGLGALDVANSRRVVRALERCLASGRTLAELADDFAKTPGPFAAWQTRVTCLTCDPEVLQRRLELRVHAMLADGLVEEVARLRDQGLESNPSAAGAIGYRETLAVLRGEAERAGLAEAIIRSTRALVKKQRTWFRTQLPPHRAIRTEEASVAALFEA